MDRYNRIVNRLRNYKPEKHESSRLKERILMQLDSDREANKMKSSFFELLFGWTDIVWLRRSMLIISFSLIILFVAQQYLIFNRIDSLEKRMTGISTESILDFQKENMHANSVAYRMSEDVLASDSVKVSSSDLNSLIKSYRDLQERYNNLKGAIDHSIPETSLKENSKIKL